MAAEREEKRMAADLEREKIRHKTEKVRLELETTARREAEMRAAEARREAGRREDEARREANTRADREIGRRDARDLLRIGQQIRARSPQSPRHDRARIFRDRQDSPYMATRPPQLGIMAPERQAQLQYQQQQQHQQRFQSPYQQKAPVVGGSGPYGYQGRQASDFQREGTRPFSQQNLSLNTTSVRTGRDRHLAREAEKKDKEEKENQRKMLAERAAELDEEKRKAEEMIPRRQGKKKEERSSDWRNRMIDKIKTLREELRSANQGWSDAQHRLNHANSHDDGMTFKSRMMMEGEYFASMDCSLEEVIARVEQDVEASEQEISDEVRGVIDSVSDQYEERRE